MEMTEEKVNELEDRLVQSVQSEQRRKNKEERCKNKQSRRLNIPIIGDQKEGKSEAQKTYLKKHHLQNFPNLAKGINLQSHETQQISNNVNLKKSMPTHIIVKLLKS